MANTITLTALTRGAVINSGDVNLIQVKVTDSSGAAVASSAVTLSISSGAGLSVSSVTTDSTGYGAFYAYSSTSGSYTITAAQTGATSATLVTIFTTPEETAAADRVLDTMQSALIDQSGAGYIGYNSATTYASGTLGSAFNIGGTELANNNSKLARWIDIEDYADTASASGDWTTAIQAALDAANLLGIYDVRGTGQYVVSNTLYIRAVPISGMNISIYKLSVSSSFPTNTSFWDATPIIAVGQAVGAIVGLQLNINYLDGGGVADGVAGINLGFGLSNVHIGYASDCISVIRMGDHQYNSSGNRLTGHYWLNNWLGVFLANGTGTADPIVESWNINVDFIANNRWGGIWFFSAGQYAKIQGDWDFNGRYLGIIELSDTTGLTSISGQTGLKLTDGTTQMEFLFYYTEQGSTYVVVAASNDISISGANALPWAAGSTISCTTVTGVALVFSSSVTAGDNSVGTNFFDVLHDYERAPFGKIQVVAGYLSSIIGGNLFTSSFQFQNSFSAQTDSIRGFGVSNSSTTLSLYNYAISNTPFANVNDTLINFDKKLSLSDHLYEGAGALNIVAPATTAIQLLLLTNATSDKYLNEGSMYEITLKTNFVTCGLYRVFVVGDTGSYSHVVVSTFSGDQITVTFTDTTDGVALNFLQATQADMQVVTNVVRI